MAGRKLPILPSNPTPSDDDLMYGVDVSDTSESAAGTSKQSTFVNIYTYILGKLSAALRLIPSGGTTGQVLAKSSNTDYEVAWTTTLQTNTTFAPTITAETNGTFTITNFIIDSIGDVVTFSFYGQFDLDPLETSGACKFNLPAAFQPTTNWASVLDVNVVLSANSGIITAESKLIADDSGTKLLLLSVGSIGVGDSVKFSAVGRYKIA